MALPIVMPKLAMAMKQGKVVEWKAEEGQKVEKGRSVFVIETEKVTYEIESPGSGFFHRVVELKVNIPVNQVVAYLAETPEELAELQARKPGTGPRAAVGAAVTPQPPAPAAAASADAATEGKVRISPAAKKMAQDAGLDYSRITGTGPDGRIVKEDVLRAIEAAQAAPAPTEETGELIDGKRVKTVIPLTGMRKAIADHMVYSLAVSAQLTSFFEVDMTEMKKLRAALVAKEATLGIKITYTDLMLMALAKAAQAVPIVNSSLIGDEIKVWDDINLGLATAYDRGGFDTGLIVPVIRNADRMSLTVLAKTARDLTRRAREGKLGLDDLLGGTITLSNFGAFSGRWGLATPIINQPQAVIIGTGAIVDSPAVVDGQLTVRPLMTVSVTFDHRILDGLPIGRFSSALADFIENPALLLA